jgi:hypothetical protein
MTGYFSKWTQMHLPSKKDVPGVPSVPRGKESLSTKDTEGTQQQEHNNLESVPGVPSNNKSVPQKANNSNVFSPIGTQEHKEHQQNKKVATLQYFTDFFEERAAIYQFDAGCSQSDAERLAHLDTLEELMEYGSPEMLAQFETVISKPIMH